MVERKEIKGNDLAIEDDPLVSALINGKNISKETIEGKLPNIREKFGIPKATTIYDPTRKRTILGSGGWDLKNPWPRTVDFKRSRLADPVLYLALQSVSVPSTAKAVARQIRNLRKTTEHSD